MKYIAMLVLCAWSSFGLSQDKKPTKEETLRFMERTVQAGVGQYGVGYIFGQIAEARFSETSYYVKTRSSTGMESYISFEGFQWENLLPDLFSVQGDDALYIRFTKGFNLTSKKGSLPVKKEIETQFIVYIPKEKIESFKKACIRLSEIAKEDNKDPFANQ